MKKIILNMAAFLVIAPATAMFAEPFYQAVLSRMGVDTAKMAAPAVAVMFDLFASSWFRVCALLAMGAGFGIWMHWMAGKWDRRLENKDSDSWQRVYADIPTSIRMQFEQGSEAVRQIGNLNVQRFHGQRAAFRFSGEDGVYKFDERVIWWMFLIFKQPTTYGQIIVDAGNAVIPKYKVVDATHYGAILMFEGDIGNVAIEIRCVSPNPA